VVIPRRVLRPIVLATFLLTVLISPVYAFVSKEGVRWCTQNYVAYTRVYSTGHTEAYSPGYRRFGAWENGSNWIVRALYDTVPASGGQWWAGVWNGSLSDPGTYGACAVA
jgi:hypothetical protein